MLQTVATGERYGTRQDMNESLRVPGNTGAVNMVLVKGLALLGIQVDVVWHWPTFSRLGGGGGSVGSVAVQMSPQELYHK